MRRSDWRIIVGILLILAGGISLLEKTGVIPPGIDLFGAIIGLGGGAAFLYVFFRNPSGQWWAAIPGFTLLGLGAAGFLPSRLDGVAFLGGIGLAFWVIYLTNPQHWWAIIPGGVLVTLAAVSGLSEAMGRVDTGSIFFLGLGLTFLLVALLARQNWAYIPMVLLLAGVLGLSLEGLLDWLWIGVLFLAGLVLVMAALLRR
ncbi:MAG: hypothetical protein D6793_06370 [Thermoflexia bacterium]|nr:MAG: hypothetical protein D6793_06370 [Thermoflexia bacterium]